MSIAASILSSLAAGGVLAVVWVFKFQPCHFEDGSYTYLSWDLGDHNTLNGCVFNWHPVLVRSPRAAAGATATPEILKGNCEIL